MTDIPRLTIEELVALVGPQLARKILLQELDRIEQSDAWVPIRLPDPITGKR